MAIHKHKLSYDPAESDDYDVVASYLRASDGTLITHTGSALDVNIKTSDISIDVDLDHTTGDSVQIGDGTEILEVNADGSINAVVTATDLDIRDLQFASDSVDVSGSEVSLDASTLAALETITVEQGTSPWVVSATDLDIRDLSASQDSISISDGTDTLAIEADGSINVNSSEAGFSGCNYEAVTVNNTATDLLATELSGRKEITVQNVGNKDVYLGCDSSVTSSNGLLIPKGATASYRLGDSINVHAITPSGSSEVRIMELS